jgi:DNA-binding PadR family transcriptional regulator
MPLSGYDLMKMFDDSVNFYWPATHTQIYRTLKQLLEQGKVSQEIVHQTEHPDKKVYSITDRGREDLRHWTATPLELPTIRHALLVQLASASLIDDDQIIALLGAYAEKLRQRLALYNSDDQRGQLDYAHSERQRFLWSLILENGIQTYECELKWVGSALQRFRTEFRKGVEP